MVSYKVFQERISGTRIQSAASLSPLLTKQIASIFKRAISPKFSEVFSVEQHSLPSFAPTRISRLILKPSAKPKTDSVLSRVFEG